MSNLVKIPGLCDVHVHFREPGFSYKETIKSGSMAAKAGGYTAVCTMPNLNPVSDSVENIKIQQDIIDRDAVISVYPYAAITVGQKGQKIAPLEELAPYCIAFSDDGYGVQDEGMMKEAMERAKALNKLIVAHCEINELLNGGYIHEGNYAKTHGHKGICSESEWRQVERDVKLSDITGCPYHVCHVSTKESIEIIKDAKMSGVNVTCETAPHYLLLCEDDLIDDGRFKMNPPIRSKKDKEALLLGITDGTIDMIATDHAPHSIEEKSKGLEKSAFGVVGLEIAFPLMYTKLVGEKIITLEKLIDLMAYAPRKRFNIPFKENEFFTWDLEKRFIVDSSKFISKGKATPFEGMELLGGII
ncbi:MAG: dihydroorotase [Ruminococcaceae bacterium]|nr:dihydroorotase [Oscillospiraceae bacterium]